jgi:hypothetical protein
MSSNELEVCCKDANTKTAMCMDALRVIALLPEAIAKRESDRDGDLVGDA